MKAPPKVRIEPTEDRQAALDWVNEILVSRGAAPIDRLPKGKIKCALDCVLSNALYGVPGTGTVVGFDFVYLDGTLVMMPPAVHAFVEKFDRGEYPDLVERRPQ